MNTPRLFNASLLLLCIGGASNQAALAGGPEPWLTFVNENDRLVSDPLVGVGDTQWKNYAWGDVNNNGWVDLVVMRRQPWGVGKRQNVLFLNESGILVDRTAEYISAVDADQLPVGVNDEGFLTPTNDADSVLVDLTNNGWLDLVTAASLSDEDPKHIGHPRVYVNLANDGGAPGRWQGFRFENARIPAMLTYSGLPGYNPRFEAVDAGDVTGNGFADLYFGDTDYAFATPLPPAEHDFNDRLLINQGAASPGFFSDETAGAFSGLVPLPGSDYPFPVSAAGWAVAVADINGSGFADIVKQTTVHAPNYVGAAYNNPPGAPGPGGGVFTEESYQYISGGVPTYISIGDLNNNGLLDLVITDDNIDRYRLNLGADANGHVVWSPIVLLPEQNAGFGGNSIIVDLDNSGWNDIIIADVSAGIPPCFSVRRTNIYRNGQDGASVTFVNGSSVLPQEDRQGVFDAAAFDLTGNGWNDLVFGRCNGTDIWINVPPALPCPADLTGNGSVGVPDLIELLANWGSCPGCDADLTGNGSVGVPDLILLLSQWGECP